MSFRLLRTVEHTCRGRLRRRCVECGRRIVAGQRYQVETAVYDGIQTLYRHQECVDLWAELAKLGMVDTDERPIFEPDLLAQYREILDGCLRVGRRDLARRLFRAVKGRGVNHAP